MGSRTMSWGACVAAGQLNGCPAGAICTVTHWINRWCTVYHPGNGCTQVGDTSIAASDCGSQWDNSAITFTYPSGPAANLTSEPDPNDLKCEVCEKFVPVAVEKGVEECEA